MIVYVFPWGESPPRDSIQPREWWSSNNENTWTPMVNQLSQLSLTKSSSDSGGGRLGPNQIFLTKRLIRPQGKKVKEMKGERGTDP